MQLIGLAAASLPLVGEYDQAHEHYTQLLILTRHHGYRHGQAEALWGLGHVASDLAEADLASKHWRNALDIYEELGVPFAETVRNAIYKLDC